MRESVVETYLREQVEALGGICEKHVSPGRRGVPDRIVTLPYGLGPYFVETKAPGKTAEPHQVRDHVRRAKLGHPVRLLDTKEKVDDQIRMWAADVKVMGEFKL